jgi:amino acid permease
MNENNNNNNNNNQENNNNFNNNNFNNKPNNSILRNRNNNNNNNNFNNNNRNNNFNYASNPYNNNNNNNNNQNGGQNYNTNVTTAQFIPQDNHAMNNLNNYNYNYSSNYGGSNQVQQSDIHSYYRRFEELPEDNDGIHIDPNNQGSFSTTLAGIHIANQLIGAGLLSAPLIMSYFGLLIGIILYIFMAIMTLYSVYILMKCHEITGKSGYSMLAKVTLGKIGNIIVKVLLIIQGFGLCSAYLRIFGESLQTVFQAWISKGSYLVEDSQVYLFILLGALIMIIFVLVKKISNLKRFTYLGLIIGLIICLSISILLFYKGVGDYLDSDISWDFLFPDCSFADAFQAAPTAFTAYLFHANAFSIYYSLNHRNTQSMMKATKIGVSLSLIIFFIFGIIGLFLYGFEIDDTILENFYEDMGDYQDSNAFIVIMIMIISLFFILLCLTSFPVLFKTMTVNFINSVIICTKGCRRGSEQEVEISQNSSHEKQNYVNKRILSIISFLSYVLIVVFAILIYRIQAFLTIVGATTGIFFIFILPNLFYMLIMKQTGKNFNKCLPIGLVGFGVFFLMLSFITAFM